MCSPQNSSPFKFFFFFFFLHWHYMSSRRRRICFSSFTETPGKFLVLVPLHPFVVIFPGTKPPIHVSIFFSFFIYLHIYVRSSQPSLSFHCRFQTCPTLHLISLYISFLLSQSVHVLVPVSHLALGQSKQSIQRTLLFYTHNTLPSWPFAPLRMHASPPHRHTCITKLLSRQQGQV